MDFDNNIPIYVQVINDIKKDIVNSKLVLGEKMPSGRDLALKYKINPNTANRIYKELEAEEICFTKRGLGTYVTEDKEKVLAIRNEMAGNLMITFIDGMKNLSYSKEEVVQLIEKEYDNKE
jgi:DNA-binding transcriptional regulator YhcF (GntR family)